MSVYNFCYRYFAQKGGGSVSVGIGGFAKMVAEDERTAIYEYGGINLNSPNCRNDERRADGMIMIAKSKLVAPEIHQRKNDGTGARN